MWLRFSGIPNLGWVLHEKNILCHESFLAASCASFVGLLLRTICLCLDQICSCASARDIKHPLHLVTTPMLAAPLWRNFPCLERGNDTNGGVWGPWPLRFEESHLAHPRLLCAQRWWPLWGLGLAGKHTEGIASFRSPTLWRDIVVLRSKSACKILRLILVIWIKNIFFGHGFILIPGDFLSLI
jgi:hypothetical protein